MRIQWLGLLGLALLSGCRGSAGNGVIVVSGHVEATEVRVSAKVAGTAQRVVVEEGDAVKVGQLLAEIDTTDTRLALAAARSERELADAELRLRVVGARPEDVAAGESQLRRAEIDLASAARDLERMEGLLASGSGTAKGRDDARLRRDLALTGVEQAREMLRKLQKGSRKEEIEAARARFESAGARIAQIEQQLKDATIVSPVEGIVTERLIEPGELAARGTGVAVVADLAGAWLSAYVPETDLGRIRLGQKALVVSDDRQQREGMISFVASKAEFTPKNVQTRDERAKLVYKVKIRLPNSDGLFKAGMPAEARITAVATVGR
jgi:HlyD family secretion protein